MDHIGASASVCITFGDRTAGMPNISDDFVLAIYNAVGASLAIQNFTLSMIGELPSLNAAQVELIATVQAKLEDSQNRLAAAMDTEMKRLDDISES